MEFESLALQEIRVKPDKCKKYKCLNAFGISVSALRNRADTLPQELWVW
jgi:hypothetical protein